MQLVSCACTTVTAYFSSPMMLLVRSSCPFLVLISKLLWTGFAYYVWIFAVIECHLGLVCASLPTLRPLFQRFLGTVYSRSSPPKNSNSGISNDSVSMNKPQLYPLQSYPPKVSTEWDKTSNSSSAPFAQTSRTWRTDNLEVGRHTLRAGHSPV